MIVTSLHITNGDSVLHGWKRAGLPGTQMAWRDVLHEGPVPAGLALEELSRVRAGYLAEHGYGNPIKLNYEFQKRDAMVRRAPEFDEVVLWFEHDLFDQLQLLQILQVLRETGLGAGTVQLVQSDRYLGMLAPEELSALAPKRRFLATAAAHAAQRSWEAFTAEDPVSLARAAAQPFPGLPFLRDALARLCEEYPHAESGLSRTQKQLLQAAAQGARRKEDLFQRSQAQEEAAFMGDATCYAKIAELCAEPAPLLCELEQGFEVTVMGRRVLAGDLDWLEHQPLDRWIGGVQLTSERHWRWDEHKGCFVLRRERAG